MTVGQGLDRSWRVGQGRQFGDFRLHYLEDCNAPDEGKQAWEQCLAEDTYQLRAGKAISGWQIK